MSTLPTVTEHAVDRYLDRVDPAASRQEARAALHRILCLGRRRSRPRHWMRTERLEPDLSFVYWAGLPDVCLLVVDEAVVTVKTRKLFREEPRRHLQALPPPPREERRWRWDGSLDEAA